MRENGRPTPDEATMRAQQEADTWIGWKDWTIENSSVIGDTSGTSGKLLTKEESIKALNEPLPPARMIDVFIGEGEAA